MTNFTDEDLDNYLQNQVDLRHRLVSKSVEDVQNIIKDLIAEVSSKDARFQSIANSGVHNAILKDQPDLVSKCSALIRGRCAYNPAIQVLTPTLFLILVPLQGLMGYKKRRTRQWRYYTQNGSHLLSPVREPEKLHQWLELESFVNLSQEWHDARMIIEGDIVPAKVVNVFKEHLEASIKTCRLTKGSHCKYFAVATSNYHWLLSISWAEQVLLSNIDWDGGCRRKCYRVVRQLKEGVWCPGSKPIITAYHLQVPAQENILRLMQKLHKCVSQHHLRHYFVRSHNLLKYSNTNELDDVPKKINNFLDNPGTYVH
uniref:Mab-21-like 3 n=2 Tax=Cyprinus carpio TaxID=7962 RepID=A0A8C0YLY3_CYPCA